MNSVHIVIHSSVHMATVLSRIIAKILKDNMCITSLSCAVLAYFRPLIGVLLSDLCTNYVQKNVWSDHVLLPIEN